jgi:hypothetical protein
MKKRRSNLKVVSTPESKTKGALVNSPSQTAEPILITQIGRSGVAEAFGKQVFSSEEQALEMLVDQVVERYEDDPEEQDEMRRFLNTVLETDPVLRSEILSGAVIRR